MNSSSEEEEEKFQKKRAKAQPIQKPARTPKMSVISSTKPSLSTGQETSFDVLLANEKARDGMRVSGKHDRPNGEMRTTWKEDTKKGKGTSNGERPKGDQTNGTKARRSASKNVFRRM
jgi:hypothetical protein